MHKQNFSTKAMVEAGLISTMMVAMFLLTVNLPMFSGLSLFILPVPVAVLCIRHNYKAAAGAVFVSAVLTGMLYNPFIALRLRSSTAEQDLSWDIALRPKRKSGPR